MQKQPIALVLLLGSVLVLSKCAEKKADEVTSTDGKTVAEKINYGGFDSQVDWGQHLVEIGGCNDCHTPKKMSPMGPVVDSSLLLSGHPAQMPPPNVNRKEMESKGYAVTQTLTAWIGPWGISFAGNLTPDSTGIGNWKEEQFLYSLRNGRSKGLPDARPMLPPMPWESFKYMSDDEIKAIFAYLKTVKPISNVVPEAVPPASAVAAK